MLATRCVLASAMLFTTSVWASGGTSEAPAEAPAAEEHGEEQASDTHGDHHSDLVIKPARQSSRDVKLPTKLVAMIDKAYRQYLLKNKLPERELIKRQLLNVSVEIRDPKRTVLAEDVKVVTPLGGGVVDLQDFIAPIRGAFTVKLVPEKEDRSAIADMQVFYISQGKPRRIDGDEFGAGCNRFMTIGNYFNKRMADTGFKLYSAGQRYVSVLAGTFVLVAFDKDAVHVGSVTFKDSRYPELVCDS